MTTARRSKGEWSRGKERGWWRKVGGGRVGNGFWGCREEREAGGGEGWDLWDFRMLQGEGRERRERECGWGGVRVG